MLGILQDRRLTYKCALARFVFSLETGIPKLCYGRLDFLGTGERLLSDLRLEYEKLMLIQTTLSLEDASTLASELAQEKRLELSDVAIQLKGNFNRVAVGRYVPSRQSLAQIRPEWPSVLFEFRPDGDSVGNPPHDPQVKLNLPFYPSGNEAITEFCQLEGAGYPQTQILFILPDFRARIRAMKLMERRVGVSVEAREESLKNLRAKFYVEGDGRRFRSDDLALDDGSAEFRYDGDLRLVMVHILSAAHGDDIDSRSFSPYGDQARWSEGVLVETSELRVKELVRAGEGSRVEFKASLPEDEHRFLDSVIAFANTNGGTVLLGVDDNGEVSGIKEKTEKTGMTIMNWISEKCDPPPQVSLAEVELDGKRVIILDVPQGANKPYQDIDKGFFVRRGASNRQAKRAEIAAMFSEHQVSRYS
jgi:hypothetical protein